MQFLPPLLLQMLPELSTRKPKSTRQLPTTAIGERERVRNTSWRVATVERNIGSEPVHEQSGVCVSCRSSQQQYRYVQ